MVAGDWPNVKVCCSRLDWCCTRGLPLELLPGKAKVRRADPIPYPALSYSYITEDIVKHLRENTPEVN